MLTIIELSPRADGGHGLQSQSHRTQCWLEGWVTGPPPTPAAPPSPWRRLPPCPEGPARSCGLTTSQKLAADTAS